MPVTNPDCPYCGKRLVYVATVVKDYIFIGWMCDCRYVYEESEPPELLEDIEKARFLGPDGSICYNANKMKALTLDDIMQGYHEEDPDAE